MKVKKHKWWKLRCTCSFNGKFQNIFGCQMMTNQNKTREDQMTNQSEARKDRINHQCETRKDQMTNQSKKRQDQMTNQSETREGHGKMTFTHLFTIG